MNQKIYQVDAFASKLFQGNPAAVCILENWPSDSLMQKIAMENNLSETAFLVKINATSYDLRWFTPAAEVNLCGHATLASAHVIFSEYEFSLPEIHFNTKSGILTVSKVDSNKYLMDLPCDVPICINEFEAIEQAMNVKALACYKGKDDYLLIVDNEQAVINARPNIKAISEIDSRGVLISATGDNVDFVSRGFFPNVGIEEDPVTGSAHTLLTPYWAHKLRKNRLSARQLSKRSGTLECVYKGDRVALIGNAVTYLSGIIYID